MPTLIITPMTDHNPSAIPNAEGQYPIQLVRGSIIPVPDNCCDDLVYTSDGGIGLPDGEGGFTPLGSQPLPPIAGDGKRCDAASSAVQVYVTLHEEILTRFDAGLTFITIATAIATTLLILIAVPFAWFAIFEIITLAAGVLAVITTDDFNETIQEELKCIFYCNSTEHEDGTVTFAFSSVVAEVEALAVGLDMWRAIQYYLSITGEDGLNRAGATGVVTGATCECADCPIENCYVVADNQTSFLNFHPVDGFCFGFEDECRRVDETGMWCDAPDTNSMVWYCVMTDAWGTTGSGAKNVVVTFSPTDDLIGVGWCTDATASDAVWLTYDNNTQVEIPANKLLIIRVRCSSAHVTKLCAENA